MKNFDLAAKKSLQAFLAENQQVAFFLSYNPNTILGNPETTATAAGYTQYYREVAADLIEVLFTAPWPPSSIPLNAILSENGQSILDENGSYLLG